MATYSPGVPATHICTPEQAKARAAAERLAEIAKSEGIVSVQEDTEVKRGRGRPRKATNEQSES